MKGICKKMGLPGLDAHRLIAFRNLEPKLLLAKDGTHAEYDPKHACHQLVLNDGMTQRRITREGAGISINSLWLVYDDLADGSLVRVLPEFATADKTALWLIYPKSNVVSTKVRVLLDFLIKHIGRRKPWDNLDG